MVTHSPIVRGTNARDPADLRSVLLIEDDPRAQRRIETLLESAGYSVTSVDSVKQARQAVAAVFDPIVVVSRHLPDGEGHILCEELREGERPSRVFILVLSTRHSQLDVGRGLRAGADVYLSKRASGAEL
ncbi:response regulator transcription factor [Steroidobacter sp.]|uniref:response regulator transcription factor n=1 Tax=Steroidobacter sp. TaxID=1978227 RepID=UPI001A451C1F|nr:response regulator [Steroidobacter sp.]MBL8266606.1 response regulator transcription factor [Steroidobacter sp.]